MRAFYSDHFILPLPAGHRFPMAKYRALRDRVAAELPRVRLTEAEPVNDGELALAHDPEYIERVVTGRLTAAEQRAIGFPWSAQMVERSRRSAGATVAACRAALVEGMAVNLAGGTHHAFRGRGAGYCVFNDAALAARLMQAEALRTQGRQLAVAIVDLDVHQGDGTASILADDLSVFTLSLHGEKNFPFRKAASDLDVPLPDGTGDVEYLTALDAALSALTERCAPGLLIYLAGADAHEGDRLGKLRLTTEGMRVRDQRVFDLAERLGLPIAVAMAGGYGRDLATTVAVHLNTVRGAFDHWQRRSNPVRAA
ncbi:MAG: histone deacetylase [Burkholderiaceae bacterium]|nr:histone deacetylase [Burkholderiaceae bacterium]